MNGKLFEVPGTPIVPVMNEAAGFPVHRIFCVGRNYAAHAAEMGVEVDREAPFYFTKSQSTICLSGSTISYPPGTEDFHHEMEFVVAIGAPSFQLSKTDALSVVYGYACGLDMTRRDLQAKAKEGRKPWDVAKDVEHSAVIGPITKASDFPGISSQRIHMSVNGELRQDGSLSELIWNVEEIISHLSGLYNLVPGDLIYTGTPSGVGPVVSGDHIEGRIDGLEPVTLTISEPASPGLRVSHV